MAEHVDDAMKNADEAIAALKRQKPTSDIEARARSAELVRLQQILLEASRKVVDANAAKRLANGNGARPVMGEATSLSDGVIKTLAEGLVPFLRETITEAVTPLRERLDAIEKRKGLTPLAARLTQIEMNSLRYEGVWSEEKTYTRGSFVTHGGSLWFAEDTSIGARPGAGSSTWKLAVKKGHAER